MSITGIQSELLFDPDRLIQIISWILYGCSKANKLEMEELTPNTSQHMISCSKYSTDRSIPFKIMTARLICGNSTFHLCL